MDIANSRIHPDYIAAVLLIAMAISEFYKNMYFLDYLISDFGYDSMEFFYLVVICAIGAAVLLLTKHNNVAKTMSVGSMIFALISIDDAIMDLVILGQYTDYDLDLFISGAIYLALGLIIIVNILIYWSKASANLNIMFYSLAGFMFLYVVWLLRLYRNGISVMELMGQILPDLPMLVLLVFIMLLLRSDSVKIKTMMYDIRGSFNEIRESAVPIGIRIDRSKITELNEIVENGLSCDRYVITLNSFHDMDYKIVLTRTGDRTTLDFSSLNDETDVGMIRFMVKDVWTDTGDAGTCDIVRIYSDDMFFIQLIAGGPFIDRSVKVPLKQRVKAEFAKMDGVHPVLKADQKDSD